MKRIIVTIAFIISILSAYAQRDTSDEFRFFLKKWNLKVIDFENFYPTYLADPLAVRFEVSSQTMLYSDIDFFDEINEGEEYKGKLVINPGVRISAFKFRSKTNPELGFEVELGVTIPTTMRAGNHDLIAVDGIYYFAVAVRPFEWLNLRFSKHHICTHVGDEFPSGKVISPSDIDPNMTQLPVRDDFILSASVKPLYFLNKPKWNILHVYGDFGFFKPGTDFMGSRQNKPHNHAFLNLQTGAELEYYFVKEFFGGVFAAYNVSAYQLNAYSPNQSVMIGYIFPQTRNEKKLRVGLNYYNGRSLANQFYNKKEKFIAFSVAIDI